MPNHKRFQLISLTVLVLITGLTIAFFISVKRNEGKIVQQNTIVIENNLPDTKTTGNESYKALNVKVEDYFWDVEKREDSGLEQSEIPEIVEGANKLLAAKLGEEFFDSYVKYSPERSAKYGSLGQYDLTYIVTIPEKDIAFKTTSHPVVINLSLNQDLSLVLPEQLEDLPNCVLLMDCLSYLDKQAALEAAASDIKKRNIKVTDITLDWDLKTKEWYINYLVSKETMKECEFDLGGNVTLYFDAVKNEITKTEEACNVPGL